MRVLILLRHAHTHTHTHTRGSVAAEPNAVSRGHTAIYVSPYFYIYVCSHCYDTHTHTHTRGSVSADLDAVSRVQLQLRGAGRGLGIFIPQVLSLLAFLVYLLY